MLVDNDITDFYTGNALIVFQILPSIHSHFENSSPVNPIIFI